MIGMQSTVAAFSISIFVYTLLNDAFFFCAVIIFPTTRDVHDKVHAVANFFLEKYSLYSEWPGLQTGKNFQISIWKMKQKRKKISWNFDGTFSFECLPNLRK